MANTEDSWNSLNQVNNWIKIADTKSGVVIAADGVLGGVLLRALPAYEEWGPSPWKVGVLLSGLALVCVSTLMSLWVFAPRLRVGEAHSLLYFDHIARRYARPDEFSKPYLAMLEQQERLNESLAEQLWATSKVARRKFRSVTLAVWLLGAGLLFAVVGGLLPS